MSERRDVRSEIQRAIDESPGMAFVNRSHTRTFSMNIFLMNSQELVELAQQIQDPDEGLRLMSQANQEAGTQTHREINRRVHNFAAAAFTLVDHTRHFIKEHYKDTDLATSYQAKIDAEFTKDPLAQFVQKLRNFMLHKGLPNSEMYFNITAGGAQPGVIDTIETGARLNSANLLEWDGWSRPGRKFIEASGKYVDILSFTEAYTEKIVALQNWLQEELTKYHSEDIRALQALQKAFQDQLSAAMAKLPGSAGGEPTQRPTNAAPASSTLQTEIDARALEIKNKIRRIEFLPAQANALKTERPVHAIADAEILAPILFWGQDAKRQNIIAFIYQGEDVFGLDADVFNLSAPLAEQVLKLDWAAGTLSRTFIRDTLLEWLRAEFAGTEAGAFTTALKLAADKEVMPFTLWSPIARIEIEAPLAMGPVRIAPISKAMLDGFEEKLLTSRPDMAEKTKQMVAGIRTRMQGFAAVVVEMTAEAERLREDGDAIARATIGLLRFCAPAAAHYPLICTAAPMGSEIASSSNALILGEYKFVVSESADSASVPDWRISEAEFQGLRENGLDILGTLILPEKLSPFGFAIRASILLHSTGSTRIDPVERLSYTFSALEKLLLLHSAEAVEFNVARRMSVLRAANKPARAELVRIVRQAYRIRERMALTALAPHEHAIVAAFIQNAYVVLRIALASTGSIHTIEQFAAEIDKMEKYVPAQPIN